MQENATTKCLYEQQRDNGTKFLIDVGQNNTRDSLYTYTCTFPDTVTNFWRRQVDSLELKMFKAEFSVSSQDGKSLPSKRAYVIANTLISYKLKLLNDQYITKTEADFYKAELDRYMFHSSICLNKYSTDAQVFEANKKYFKDVDCVKNITRKAY